MDEETRAEREKDTVCAVCKRPATHRCGSCKIVYYCSRQHQESDWKKHSENCQIYKLVEDPSNGRRRYVATRQIENGEIVISDDKPLLLLPEPTTKLMICMNCYVPQTFNSVKPCNHCGWPLCVDCKSHGPECQLTMKYQKTKINIKEYSKSGIKHMFHHAVIVMRALALRETNPGSYKKLMRLGDRSIDRMKKYNYMMENSHIARILKTVFMIDDADERVIGKILAIVMIDGFENKTAKDQRNVVVFEKLSRIESACCANCSYSCCDDGSPITITCAGGTLGTVQRRHILRESKFFDCICERCKDPTEFGTMFSAIKCLTGNCDGYMLPSTFVVPRNETIPNYICNMCNFSIPSATINEMMERISVKFSKVDQDDVDKLKQFINDQAMILHQNHFHIFNAEFKLAQTFFTTRKYLTSVTDELYKENITLCKKMIGLFRILMPAEIGAIRMLLRMTSDYTVALASRLLHSDPAEILKLIKESIEQLNEMHRLGFGEQMSKEDALTMDFLQATMEELELRNN